MPNATPQRAAREARPAVPRVQAATDVPPSRPRVCVFGRLRVEEPDGAVRIPAGDMQRQLLVLLALRGGAVHVEQVADALWPEEPVEVAQGRLRNVLARLAAECGDIVRREGPTLVLDADTDLADYEDTLSRLLAYRGAELALDALYSDWAQPARRRLDILRNQLLPALLAG